MPKTDAQKAANARYKKHITRITVEFYLKDNDLLEHLERQSAKQTYIKDLIRADMSKKE